MGWVMPTDDAKRFSDIYERWNPNEDPGVRAMDLHNNQKGRDLSSYGSGKAAVSDAVLKRQLRLSPFRQ